MIRGQGGRDCYSDEFQAFVDDVITQAPAGEIECFSQEGCEAIQAGT